MQHPYMMMTPHRTMLISGYYGAPEVQNAAGFSTHHTGAAMETFASGGAVSAGTAYGAPPAAPSETYGVPPAAPSEAYGVPPAAPSETYGVPSAAPSPTYGAPPAVPSETYGVPCTQCQEIAEQQNPPG